MHQGSECWSVWSCRESTRRGFVLYPSPKERQLSNKSLWFLTLLPPPRSCLAGLWICQNGAKQCQVWGTGELFLLLFLVRGAPGRAILALLCCSFQRSSLSQENQMRVTSGHGASAKPLLFCSWQEDDVLQMPGSLWNVKCIPCIFFASSPASISLVFCFTNGQIQISFPDA